MLFVPGSNLAYQCNASCRHSCARLWGQLPNSANHFRCEKNVFGRNNLRHTIDPADGTRTCQNIRSAVNAHPAWACPGLALSRDIDPNETAQRRPMRNNKFQSWKVSEKITEYHLHKYRCIVAI